MPMFLKAAINGARSKTEHSALPVTAENIAHDANEAIAAGADAIHLHVRNDDGLESLDPNDVARCIMACRATVPFSSTWSQYRGMDCSRPAGAL